MKKILLVLFTILLNNIQAQTNNEVLISLREFINFFPNNYIIEDKNWTEPNDPKIWKDLIITQQLKINTIFYELNCYNRNRNDGSWDGILLQYYPKKTNETSELNYFLIKDAKQIYQDITNVFGQPDKILDYGFISESQYRQDFIGQWDKGQYSIQLTFMDLGYIDGKPGILAGFLELKSTGSFQNIIPLLGINIIFKSGMYLSQNSWYPFTNSEIAQYSNLSLILDYNTKKVLLPNFKERADIINLSDSQATLVFYDNRKILFNIVLNRYTGSIELDNYNDRGNITSKLKGIAERIDLQFKPLF
jgi:hypothetical protein